MYKRLLNSKLFTIVVFCILWSVVIVYNKYVLNSGADPLLYYLYYQAIATILICAYAFIIQKHHVRIVNLSALYKIIGTGLLIAVALYTTAYGLKLSTSINYGFIIKAGVIFGPLLAFLFLKERLSLSKILLMLAFIVGLYLVTTGGKLIVPQKRDLLILISALFFALSDILLKKLTNKLPSSVVASMRGVLVTIFLFLIVLLSSKNFTFNIPLTYLIISGVLAGIAQLLAIKALSLSSVSYVSFMSMLTPLLVSLFGAFFLREPFTIWHLVGGTIIIASGIMVQKKGI